MDRVVPQFLFYSFITGLLIASCGQQTEKEAMSAEEAVIYNETLDEVKSLERQLAGLSSSSIKEMQAFLTDVANLQYKNDTTGMSTTGKEACKELDARITVLKRNAETSVSQQMRYMTIPVEVNDDCLLENTTTYPVYLEREDVLYYSIGLQKPGVVKLYNADARQHIKTYTKSTRVADSLVIANKGIYLIEITPGSTQYASIDVHYRMGGRFHPLKDIKSEEVACEPGDFRAMSNKGITMRTAFDQPRKFTLSSQLKSTFSTSAKSIAIVAVPIPAGTTDVLYNLRISTNEQDRYVDGKFPENMMNSYHKVRFLGLPIYESTREIGLFNQLLANNRPPREEDAYCNLYVFRNQTAAKQFQDGTKLASQLQYDVDYSTLGTQSCNGRIPTKGVKTLYLAFENERVRYANYIWVEVLTVTPTTEYHATKYTIE